MEEKYPHKPLSFKQWVANFWYYYKWLFLAVLVCVVFIVICTVQYFSADEYDSGIFYVDSVTLSVKTADDIIESVSSVIKDDYNGDGKKNTDLETVTLSSDYNELLEKDPNAKYQYEALKDYNNELLAGECCILLLDPYFYDQLQNDGVLEYIPIIGGYGLPISDLDISKLPGFSALPKDTVICFKAVGAESKMSPEEKDEVYQNSFLVLQDILLYESK